MKVTTLDEKSIHDIGHAFGYYDYGEETGISAAFSGKEATANYICAYVRGVLRGGFLHTTGERGEGYIAYKLPKQTLGIRALLSIACGMLHNSTPKRLLQFGIAIKRGGTSPQDRMDKEKKPYIFQTVKKLHSCPTASLDVENETAIQEALSRLIKNKTVLIIAHRMRTVAGADQVVVLSGGIVAEQGSPAELYARKGLYAHMVDLQSTSQNWTI